METDLKTKKSTEAGKGDSATVKEQKITPFLWFDGKAEEAMKFYTAIFRNSRIINTMPGTGGSIMSGTFLLNGHEFIALNAGPMFSFSPAISFFVTCETEQEIGDLWARLSSGGKTVMELGKYPFSEKYGWVEDQFGVSWQLGLFGSSQKISPALLFVGTQAGKAEEAIQFYTAMFPNSAITQIERYSDEDQDPAGTVKYASFTLHGQEFSVMDSHMEHAFAFTPAISFLVKCSTQAEIDEYWEELSTGGDKQKCGWIQDKYGVSWQIVPPILGKLLGEPDRVKSKRVMDAMLQMDKIIIADLEKAYQDDTKTKSESLIITRTFNLPVNRVWQAWTNAEDFKKWWGPKDYTCTYASLDVKVGGKYLSNMRSSDGTEYWSTGHYKEIVLNKKLVFTDSFSDNKGNVIPAADLNMPGNWPMELLVTLDFEENDGKTSLRLNHEGLPPEMINDCKAGWQESFDKLSAKLS